MARQGLQARVKRRRGLTRPDKAASAVPDLVKRDFTAERIDQKLAGDFKQVNTDEGPVFIATVEDLFSRRMLGFAQSDRYPTADWPAPRSTWPQPCAAATSPESSSTPTKAPRVDSTGGCNTVLLGGV